MADRDCSLKESLVPPEYSFRGRLVHYRGIVVERIKFGDGLQKKKEMEMIESMSGKKTQTNGVEPILNPILGNSSNGWMCS